MASNFCSSEQSTIEPKEPDFPEDFTSTNLEEREESGPSICQYFLKGKCRFGDKCFNSHQTSQTENTTKDCADNNMPHLEKERDNMRSNSQKKNKILESEKTRKKPPMKTATNVINRIQWDEKLNPEDFTVGYLDRFVGVVEKSFNSFDWEDVTSVDQTILAIPRHRVQYFKYHDELVWDKNKRLDCVFGSTGSGLTIADVIENYKQQETTENQMQNINE